MSAPSTTKPVAITPIAYALAHNTPDFTKVDFTKLNDMRIALRYSNNDIEHQHKKVLGVTDVSYLRRFSVKGPNAAAWLQQHGIAIPASSNSWVAFGIDQASATPSTHASLVLRLGNSEFLVEDQFNGQACPALQQAAIAQPVAAGVYRVVRHDAAFILSGTQVLDLLSELCLLDLRDKALPAETLLMTQVAGISATLIRQKIDGDEVYRIWCDGTYGAYMWETLTKIATELGGGAVGLAQYL